MKRLQKNVGCLQFERVTSAGCLRLNCNSLSVSVQYAQQRPCHAPPSLSDANRHQCEFDRFGLLLPTCPFARSAWLGGCVCLRVCMHVCVKRVYTEVVVCVYCVSSWMCRVRVVGVYANVVHMLCSCAVLKARKRIEPCRSWYNSREQPFPAISHIHTRMRAHTHP